MDTRPVLVLAGLRRSGKSSIQRVVFSRMSPNETLFLESTHRPARHAVPGFVDFELWDLPGHADDAAAAPDLDWRRCGGLVFVLDAQDDYIDALARLHATLLAVLPGNPALPVHIFIHKVDSLPPDSLSDLQRELHARLSDELGESGINVEPSWYLTSIYDHSVFEAMSKVVQRMLKEGGGLENLLNHFCSVRIDLPIATFG